MILLKNENKPSLVMLIAENDSDMEVLHYFFDNKILMGLYEIYDRKNDKTKVGSVLSKFLQTNFPLASGIAKIKRDENNR